MDKTHVVAMLFHELHDRKLHSCLNKARVSFPISTYIDDLLAKMRAGAREFPNNNRLGAEIALDFLCKIQKIFRCSLFGCVGGLDRPGRQDAVVLHPNA